MTVFKCNDTSGEFEIKTFFYSAGLLRNKRFWKKWKTSELIFCTLHIFVNITSFVHQSLLLKSTSNLDIAVHCFFQGLLLLRCFKCCSCAWYLKVLLLRCFNSCSCVWYLKVLLFCEVSAIGVRCCWWCYSSVVIVSCWASILPVVSLAISQAVICSVLSFCSHSAFGGYRYGELLDHSL